MQRNVQCHGVHQGSLVGWSVFLLCSHMHTCTDINVVNCGLFLVGVHGSNSQSQLRICSPPPVQWFPQLTLVNRSGSCWGMEANQITKCNVKRRRSIVWRLLSGSRCCRIWLGPRGAVWPTCSLFASVCSVESVLPIIFRQKHQRNKVIRSMFWSKHAARWDKNPLKRTILLKNRNIAYGLLPSYSLHNKSGKLCHYLFAVFTTGGIWLVLTAIQMKLVVYQMSLDHGENWNCSPLNWRKDKQVLTVAEEAKVLLSHPETAGFSLTRSLKPEVTPWPRLSKSCSGQNDPHVQLGRDTVTVTVGEIVTSLYL